MAFSIKDIRSSFSDTGILQTNKFEVSITTPPILSGVAINNLTTYDTGQLLPLRAEAVRLPGVAIMTSDNNRYGVGPMQKTPYSVSFTESSITFISDGNGDIYRYFYTWLASIFDYTGINNTTYQSVASYQTNYKKYFATDVYITVFDNFGNAIQTVQLMNAFPVSMNEVPLSWSDNNELIKITVNFSFRDWRLLDVTASSANVSPSTVTSVTTF